MELHNLKRQLQDHLSDGLVLIVGSGLSAAAGLPTMNDLAKFLRDNPPSATSTDQLSEWQKFTDTLEAGTDLETALNQENLDQYLETYVVSATAVAIRPHEQKVIEQVLQNKQQLPLGSLLLKIVPILKQLPVITTNYDRLIEIAAESVQLSVDPTFYGHFIGRFDPKASKEALAYATQTKTKLGIKRVYRPHVKLLKPHGSLDWFIKDDHPIRSAFEVDLPRLMITPGKTKYLKGYDQPFDRHREEANKAVDEAARFLIIGYGFNDEQLETHLRPRLRDGGPCVILTKHLSGNGAAIIKASHNVIALTDASHCGRQATRITTQSGEWTFPDSQMWDLASFVKEVLL